MKTIVKKVINLPHDRFIVRMDRPKGFTFKAGQHVTITPDHGHYWNLDKSPSREYSLFNPIHTDYLEILVKLVPKGAVSPALYRLEAGDGLNVSHAQGHFLGDLPHDDHTYFIATGTGISPFISYIGTYARPKRLTLLYGCRHPEEVPEDMHFDPHVRFIPCISRHPRGGGRVTDWLQTHGFPLNSRFYLCGNSDMINDVMYILTRAGVPVYHIQTEIYF